MAKRICPLCGEEKELTHDLMVDEEVDYDWEENAIPGGYAIEEQICDDCYDKLLYGETPSWKTYPDIIKVYLGDPIAAELLDPNGTYSFHSISKNKEGKRYITLVKRVPCNCCEVDDKKSHPPTDMYWCKAQDKVCPGLCEDWYPRMSKVYWPDV